MKKSILLATTALISAFALNARAGDSVPTTTVTVKAIMVQHVPSLTEAAPLDFGIAKRNGSGYDVILGSDGTYNTSTAQVITAPKVGKILLSDWYPDTTAGTNLPSVVFDDSIVLVGTQPGLCGTVDHFTPGPLSHVEGFDYNIPFGATWHMGDDTQSSFSKMECTGEVTATLVLVNRN